MTDLSPREAPLTFKSSLEEGHEERKQDTLNLLPYAEALRDFIHECETPMTIGIQGDWGIGKTTLMNMLRGHEASDESGLLNSEHCKVVTFETWSYAQFYHGDNLAIACMHALTGEVGERVKSGGQRDDLEVMSTVRTAREKLENALRHIKLGVPTGPFALRGSDGSRDIPPHQDISAQMIRFRKEFGKLVRYWAGDDQRRRIVFFIDDLDRVRPAEALLLLEAIRNFIDVPGCVFVLAVDYEVIQQGMVEKFGRELQRSSGKAFYDKIIQLPFVLPSSGYQLDQFIVGLLSGAGLPFSSDIDEDPDSRQFYVDVTLCTVGRNPRNIKRVMNYARLLGSIHKRATGDETVGRDAKILFALICMQIAWPELFDYFLTEPTVDTVTSLENWDFLECLPEARELFERTHDRERLKNDVSTFFDTLFSVLDENEDGQIDSRELEPVLGVMALARMTAVAERERPRDFFVRRVRNHNAGQSALVETFLENVFMKSVWYLGSECRYRKSGSRYVTLVHEGRQIGSLVSLRNEPFVFRLAMSPEKVSRGLKDYWKSKHAVKSEAITLVRSMFDREASLTGFGDTLVDFSKMTNVPAKDAIGLLNALFRVVTGENTRNR